MQNHCINVLKVYDWITEDASIRMSKPFDQKKIVTDEICGNINLHCGENGLLWQTKGDIKASGIVTIYHEMGGCEYLEVIVNNKPAYILSQGEERTMDFHQLTSLEVRCSGNESGFCFGKYCLSIHYQVRNSCFNPGDCQLICFLSDEHGNRTHSLVCQEMTEPTGRKNIRLVLPNGEVAILQKVKVLNKGFITVQMINDGKTCKLCILPFKVIKELTLCAPLGTFLECDITDFECTAFFTDNCNELVVEVNLCQLIKMGANINIEVEANLCLPRSKIARLSNCTCPPHNMRLIST